jgi:molecular chaperone GrpE (heat shock protein)
MNEHLQQILAAAVPVLCLLITAGGPYLVALLRKAADNAKRKLDHEIAIKYIDMAYCATTKAVLATSQTFVEALKKEGAFTKEKQIEAFNMAKDMVLNILGETAITALNEIYGDFDTWLNAMIEAECRLYSKSKL